MITISNIDALIDFISNYFDLIDDDAYNKILLETLSVYSNKPKNKNIALNQILTHYNLIVSRPSNWEKPLFII